MVSSKNCVQFSLSRKEIDELRRLAGKGDESIGLIAKRVVLGKIDPQSTVLSTELSTSHKEEIRKLIAESIEPLEKKLKAF